VSPARLLALASALLVAYVLLGAFVSSAPLTAFDRAGAVFLGHDVPAAIALTRAGLLPAYAGVCAVLLAYGVVRRAWLWRVVASILTLVVAWQVSDLFKAAFHRPRPEHWIGFHETSYSYASGHATLSLAFYGLWIAYLMRSDLPAATRRVAAFGLALFILAIGWSRLALGAHYPTDLLGGYLLGGAFLCLALVIVDRRVQLKSL
jgi:membrane-associated phospholipid phosphatase